MRKSTEGTSAGTERSRVGAAWLGAGVFASVFLLPWLVPMPKTQIFSESMAVGFSNRVAMVALGVGALLMVAVAARITRRSGSGFDGFITSEPEERLSRNLVIAAVVLTVLAVIAEGILLGNRPHGDGSYFIDRLMLMSAGQTPYADFEFSYGPLLIYAPWVIWQSLAGLGVGVHAAYYAWVALCYAAAVGVTAYVLNRVRMSQVLRSLLFLLIVTMTLLNPTLGVNYSAVRFLLPYFGLLYTDRFLRDSEDAHLRWIVPVLAVMAVAIITPEMGVALGIAIVARLAYRSIHNPNSHGARLMPFIIGGVVLGIVALLARPGTLATFAAGAFYLPLLPGQPGLFFVASMLLLAWATGVAIARSEVPDGALYTGWLTLALVLIVPALGRADFLHVFWNGLGAFIAAIAVAGGRWKAGSFYFATVAAAFLIATLTFSATYSLKPFVEGSRRILYASERRAHVTAKLLHQDPDEADVTWLKVRESMDSKAMEMDEISRLPKLAFLAVIWGENTEALVDSGNLVPVYCFPARALTAREFQRALSDLEAADNMAMPVVEYMECKQAADEIDKARDLKIDADGLVSDIPYELGASGYYGQLAGFPVALHGRKPVFDAKASFGLVMQQEWDAYDTVGTYTLLRRR